MLIAKFPDGISEITVNGLHQWNYGQRLQIEASDLPALFEVHFAYPGIKDAIVRVCAAVNGVATVAIPDECLEQSRTIQAWIYEIKETAGKTTKTIRLNVIKRVRPAAGGDIPREISDKYTEAVGAMNEAVDDLKNGNVIANKANEATHAIEADHAISADKLITYEVSTLAELETLIKNNTQGSFGIRIAEHINIDGVGTLPKWGYGYLVIAHGDAALNLVGIGGVHITAYYNAVFVSTQPWAIRYKPQESDHAATADKLNSMVIRSSGNPFCLLSIDTPGIYVVNFKEDHTTYDFTATFFITDLNRTVKPGGEYLNFATVEYQPQGISEMGEYYGVISIQAADKFSDVSAKMVCISQVYYE